MPASPALTAREPVDLVVLAAGALPLPGGGRTAARLEALLALGRGDLSIARLAEGHADAVAILAEAGRAPRPGCIYGVWAAASGTGDVTATRVDGGWDLTGTKAFCSGAARCDRALVRAGDLLLDVDLRQIGVAPLEGSWPAVGMAGSDSRSVRFSAVRAGTDALLGPPGFYTARPGFWHGAIGVAAVWAGGASALLDSTVAALAEGHPGDAELAALGTAAAAVEVCRAVLERSGLAVDADPDNRGGDAERRALACRHAVHAAATAVLGAVAAAGGARPLSLDPVNARRAADLYTYLAQYHPGRDGAALGRLAIVAAQGRVLR